MNALAHPNEPRPGHLSAELSPQRSSAIEGRAATGSSLERDRFAERARVAARASRPSIRGARARPRRRVRGEPIPPRPRRDLAPEELEAPWSCGHEPTTDGCASTSRIPRRARRGSGEARRGNIAFPRRAAARRFLATIADLRPSAPRVPSLDPARAGAAIPGTLGEAGLATAPSQRPAPSAPTASRHRSPPRARRLSPSLGARGRRRSASPFGPARRDARAEATTALPADARAPRPDCDGRFTGSAEASAGRGVGSPHGDDREGAGQRRAPRGRSPARPAPSLRTGHVPPYEDEVASGNGVEAVTGETQRWPSQGAMAVW